MQMVHGHPKGAQIVLIMPIRQMPWRRARGTAPGGHWQTCSVMFGCGGDRDTGKRAEMGQIASTGADQVFRH